MTELEFQALEQAACEAAAAAAAPAVPAEYGVDVERELVALRACRSERWRCSGTQSKQSTWIGVPAMLSFNVSMALAAISMVVTLVLGAWLLRRPGAGDG